MTVVGASDTSLLQQTVSSLLLSSKPSYSKEGRGEICTRKSIISWQNLKCPNSKMLDKHKVPQKQNFVTIGQNGNQYCINRDGSLFWYLKHQSKRNQKEYVQKFPYIYEWSLEGWANFRFRGMYCAHSHFVWVPSYNLVQKSWDVNRYKMADLLDNPDCDVSICYWIQTMGWGKFVSTAIDRSEFISQLKSKPHGSQAISFIKACSDHGM